MSEELKRSHRTGAPLSIAMMDLDGFKAVNDRSGHKAGDLLLQDFANGWQRTIRGGGDFLARLGGDEFGLLAPGSDADGVRRLTERFGDLMQNTVACSIGAVTWDGSEGADDLLRRADAVMYEEKVRHHNQGGGPPELRAPARRRTWSDT